MGNANSPTQPRMLKAAEKRALAVKLRNAGVYPKEIAPKLGVSVVQVNKYLKKAFEEWEKESKEEIGQMVARETQRLESYLVPLSKHISNGNLGAIDRALKINKSIRELHGLDAPKKFANADGDDLFSGFIEALDQVHNKDDHEKPE